MLSWINLNDKNNEIYNNRGSNNSHHVPRFSTSYVIHKHAYDKITKNAYIYIYQL